MSIIYKGQTVANVGGGGGADPALEVYSTEEVRIGTWIDGKPLYRKMYTVTLPSSTNVGGYQLEPYPDEFEVKSYSGLFVDVWGAIHTVPDHWANEFLTFCFMNHYIRVSFNSTSYVSRPVTLFLEYTKTTDPAPASILSATPAATTYDIPTTAVTASAPEI